MYTRVGFVHWARIALPLVLVGLLLVQTIGLASDWYVSMLFAVSYDHPTTEGLDYASVTYIGPGPNGSLLVAGEYMKYEPYAYTDAYIVSLSRLGYEVVATVRGGMDDKPLAVWYEDGTLVVAGVGNSWDRELDPPEVEGFIAWVRGAEAQVYSYDPVYKRSTISMASYEPGHGVVFAGTGEGPVVIVPEGMGGRCWEQTPAFTTATEEPKAVDYDGSRILVAGLSLFTYGTREYMFYSIVHPAGYLLDYAYLEPAQGKVIHPESASIGDGIVVAGKTDSYPGDYRGLDAFILYAVEGQGVQWAYALGAPGHDHVPLVVQKGSRIIAAAYFDFNTYNLITILVYNTTGGLEWATTINTTWANTTLMPTALYIDGPRVLIAFPVEIEWELRVGKHVETLLLSLMPGENKTLTFTTTCPLYLCDATIQVRSYKTLDPLNLTVASLIYTPVEPTLTPRLQACTLNVRNFTVDSLRVDLVVGYEYYAPPPPPPPEEEPNQTTTATTQETTTVQTTTTQTITTTIQTQTTSTTTTRPPETTTTTTTTTTVQQPPQQPTQTGTGGGEQGRLPTSIALGIAAVGLISAVLAILWVRKRRAASLEAF